MQHDELKPVPTEQRALRGQDIFFIWFGAAIAISEIWAGGLPSLAGVGLAAGIIAILLGRLIGNGLMAAMAAIGSRTGLPTMVLTRPAFGIRGSYLPAAFNILQLLGWTGWMLFVGFLYLDNLAGFLGLPVSAEAPYMKFLWVSLLGVLCIIWAAGGQRFWIAAQRISAAALLLLTLAMTWIVFTSNSLPELSLSGVDLLGMVAASDVVVAMSVSWLPLVADYSRFSKDPPIAARSTFWGYFIAGSWMYAVGLLVACSQGLSAFGEITPDQMVIQTMGGAGLGWAVAAIVLVLLSTVTTTFLDIYSCVVSSQGLVPAIPARTGNIAVGILGVLIALFLDTAVFEPFLLAIGAIFLPLFVVVLMDHYLLSNQHVATGEMENSSGPYWYSSGFRIPALLAWLVGFIAYDWARGFSSIGYFSGLMGMDLNVAPAAIGSSLPCILATGVAYLLLAGKRRPDRQSD